MRKNLLAGVAFVALMAAGPAVAADLPPGPAYKAPAIAAPLVYNWTGFYIGANLGYGWGRGDATGLNGIVGGGQLGFDWQTGNLVFGLVTDIDWADQKATTALGILGGTETDRIRWFGTTRARLGLAADTWLFYATGGVAYGQARAEVTVPGAAATFSANGTGWAAGGGIEKALGAGWSANLEYLHIDLGNLTFSVVGIPIATARITDDIVRVGINYRFGWGGPVRAAY